MRKQRAKPEVSVTVELRCYHITAESELNTGSTVIASFSAVSLQCFAQTPSLYFVIHTGQTSEDQSPTPILSVCNGYVLILYMRIYFCKGCNYWVCGARRFSEWKMFT